MFGTRGYKLRIVALVIGTLAWSILQLPIFSAEAATARREHRLKPAPPDPCEQALTPQGNANGLHKRCDAIGIGGGTAKGDFNGDGFADLAVGVPYEDQNGVNAVGGVNVIYGSSTGLTATGDQFLDEVDFGFSYGSNDHFGWALASGDFNGDTFSDLAIGMPDWDATRDSNTGVVFVVNGSAAGLNTSTGHFLDVPGSTGRQGAALVWADFNGDGFGDLAIGSPDATVHGEGLFCSPVAPDISEAGEVAVLYGSATGLMPRFGAQVFHQGGCGVEPVSGTISIGDSIESGDRFGSSLAASRHGTSSDLVIGVPFEDLGLFDKQDAGLVHLIEGSSSGLGVVGNNQLLSQDTSGVGGAAETGDQFGRVLAMGDFNGDGRDDLAVGVPFEDLTNNGNADAGAVQVFFAGSGGNVVTTSGSMFISQADLAGVGVEAGDRMGWALAVGDFDADGRDDLAVGVPGEDVGSITDAGLVTVLYGSSTGPSLTRIQNWTQDSPGIPDVAEPGDQFGYALSAWKFRNNRQSDLAIGVPFEDIVSASTGTLQLDAGAVNMIYGNLTGLNANGRPAEFWSQDTPGILDTAQPGDHFGQVLY